MKKKLFIFTMFASALLLAACNKESNQVITAQDSQGIVFTMSEAPFGEDTEVDTRTTVSQEPQIVDIGNDIEAQITIERDAVQSEALTRAINSGNKYTIVAFKAGTAQQAAEAKGHFDAVTGDFKHDADSKIMQIEAGYYDFVCYTNQYATRSGNTLKIEAANMQKAFICRKENVHVTKQKRQAIPFVMKHTAINIRTKIAALMDYPANVTATLRFDANKVPASTNYDMVSGIYTGAEKETTSGSIVQTFSNSGIVHDAALDNNLYTMTAAEYKMFLAGTKPEELYLNFGTISLYGKNLTNLRTSIKAGDAFEANGSYTVVVKLMPRFKYLFEDGKTGYLSTPNRKDHTAIAVVFAPGRAIALWDAAANIPLYGNISDILYKQQINDRIFPTVQTALDDGADGRHWTWDASGSTDGKIKANEPTLYPAFYQAGHFYEIGLPGHLGGKTLDVSLRKNNIWYLASLKEWKEVYSNLGFGIGDLKSANGSWNNSFLQYAFTALRNNGISIARNDYTYYCTSTEFGGRNAFIFCVHNDASTIYIIAQGINSAYNFQYVRPFVAFDE